MAAVRPWPPVQWLLVFALVLLVILAVLRWLDAPDPWWRWLATTAVAMVATTALERGWRR